MRRIRIIIAHPGMLCTATYDHKTLFHADFNGEEVTVSFLYDFDERPLTLRADAKNGDQIDIRIYPARIELYVNGVICDEEWPCGSCPLEKTMPVAAQTTVWELDCEDLLTEEEPSVKGSFVQAEGWRPMDTPGIFVGDCMPYALDDRYHVLYLKDRHHHQSKWGLGAHQWEHISTTDLIHWDIHPMAVVVDRPFEGSICTGSWMVHENRQYLFYTIRMSDRSPAQICRSVSEDGYHFTKDPSFCIYLSDRYDGVSARDPKLVQAADGSFHMFLTTSLAEEKKGCLAHLVSSDLEHWTEEPAPIYVSADADQPECSDYFELNGYYYLIYSLRGVGYYQISQAPFSGFASPKDPVIPCESVPKCAVWKDRIIFTGYLPHTRGHYAGYMTFMEAVQGKDGELTYQKVKETL